MDDVFARRPALLSIFPGSPAALRRRSADLITHVGDRPGHDRRYAINYSKARRDLGYEPSFDLSRGLRSTIDWYLDNAMWWSALLGPDYSRWLKENYAIRNGLFNDRSQSRNACD
jgi:dTDP-glucose 4,6-dehydratase